jgi:hypothetical protein
MGGVVARVSFFSDAMSVAFLFFNVGGPVNDILSSWWFRAGVVAGLTWAAYRYLPVPGVGKTAIVAVGAVSIAGIIGSNIPLLGSVMQGQLPFPAAA